MMLSKLSGRARSGGALSNIRFRAKILLGFGVILCLWAISLGIAHLGFGRISTGSRSYQDIVIKSDAARDIDRHLATYRVLVRCFILSAAPADLAAAQAAESELANAIKNASLTASAEDRPTIAALQDKFVGLTKLFAQITELKTDNAKKGPFLNSLMGLTKYKISELATDAKSGGFTDAEAAIKEYAAHIANVNTAVNSYILQPDPGIVTGTLARIDFVKTSFETLAIDDAALTKNSREIAASFDQYEKTFAIVVENSAQVAALVTKMNEGADVIVKDGKSIKDNVVKEQTRLSSELFATVTGTEQFVSLLGVGGLVFGGLLAFMLGSGISRPMVGMCRAMRELAGGNFDVVLPGLGRKDELGEMAGAVEEFKHQAVAKAKREAKERDAQSRSAGEQRRAELNRFADEFEAAVGSIVTNVSTSASQLESAAGVLTRTAETTQGLTSRVAGASEEASSNVQSVASATNELTDSVSEIGRQVNDSSRIAEDAVKQAEETDERITKLSRAAQQIGDVVKLITAIAEQTNLLALNATIEAARAGDAGRGFAVVASEVKSLASQTAKATEEISSHIRGMQEATQESVLAIKEIGGTIGQISEIASTIATSVEQQSAATQEIARNVQNVAHSTQDVATSITEVNQGANQTGAASSEVLNSAKMLSADSARLRNELDRFMGNIRAA